MEFHLLTLFYEKVPFNAPQNAEYDTDYLTPGSFFKMFFLDV